MKKGYTLIELMVVLMIGAIVSLSVFMLMSKGINMIRNRQLEKCNIQLMSFINYSQNYCRANRRRGYIFFVEDKNSFKIYLNSNSEEANENGDNISEIRLLSKDYRVNYEINKSESYRFRGNSNKNYIYITNLGMIDNPGYIETQYGKKKKEITLGVGGVYGEE